MIGLIFGETNFPIEILKKIKRKKIRYLIIDLTKKKSLKMIKMPILFQLENSEKLLRFLKEKNANKFYLLEE